jgi:F-type H+-transporting ATPase subunit b
MRWTLSIVLASLVLWLAAPAVVQVAQADAGHAKTDDHGKDEAKSAGGEFAHRVGLKRTDLGIYTLIVFGLLMLILGKFAWKPLIEGLDKREASLLKTHSDAGLARDEAKKALAEIQDRLAKASDEVRAMLDEARRDAQTVKDQLKAEAGAEIQAERERLRKEIETARDQALQDIYQQSVQLASLISTKAVGRELSPADQSRLLDESLADLKANLGSKA